MRSEKYLVYEQLDKENYIPHMLFISNVLKKVIELEINATVLFSFISSLSLHHFL